MFDHSLFDLLFRPVSTPKTHVLNHQTVLFTLNIHRMWYCCVLVHYCRKQAKSGEIEQNQPSLELSRELHRCTRESHQCPRESHQCTRESHQCSRQAQKRPKTGPSLQSDGLFKGDLYQIRGERGFPPNSNH